jgi:hypothetical protein
MTNQNSMEELAVPSFCSGARLNLRNAFLLMVCLQTMGGCTATKSNLLSRQQTEPGETELKHRLFHRPDRVCLVRTPSKELLPPPK